MDEEFIDIENNGNAGHKRTHRLSVVHWKYTCQNEGELDYHQSFPQFIVTRS